MRVFRNSFFPWLHLKRKIECMIASLTLLFCALLNCLEQSGYSVFASNTIGSNRSSYQQRVLSSVIRQTFENEPTLRELSLSTQTSTHGNITLHRSSIEQICDRLTRSHDMGRVICCTPKDNRHLYNVKIENGQFILFDPTIPKSKTNQMDTNVLPPVMTVQRPEKIGFKMPVSYRQAEFRSEDCKHYINGTLHVVGRSTVNNVYHASK